MNYNEGVSPDADAEHDRRVIEGAEVVAAIVKGPQATKAFRNCYERIMRDNPDNAPTDRQIAWALTSMFLDGNQQQ